MTYNEKCAVCVVAIAEGELYDDDPYEPSADVHAELVLGELANRLLSDGTIALDTSDDGWAVALRHWAVLSGETNETSWWPL